MKRSRIADNVFAMSIAVVAVKAIVATDTIAGAIGWGFGALAAAGVATVISPSLRFIIGFVAGYMGWI